MSWSESRHLKLRTSTDAEVGRMLKGVTQPSYHPGIMDLLKEAARRLEKSTDCRSCDGTGSMYGVGCTDCLGTGKEEPNDPR